ncbi:MAG: S-methyl-5-thioribose-1-phosphate isomerase [Candidatus Omnitrophica bacterium CG11_big_fil_rev_8_21_14_0_20_63_9]|nr:MAG: S-methyl-5-thioribose-1-phosphate isomerase [Candidatus Omnitrophica bacterium CG11_big_fil_rev_8_21_14_0_20_63_9]
MRVNGVHYRTVWMEGGAVKLIDQRLLPFTFAISTCRTHEETAAAIRDMVVRGAGAIGAAAGFAMAQAALRAAEPSWSADLSRGADMVRATRPTAQNLFYAVDRVLRAASTDAPVEDRRRRAIAAAQAIADEDASAGQRIGELGQALIPPKASVLTHCNAGWLAFADWGSALAPIYRAHRDGKQVHVWATETRPRGQGAKLTAWELIQEGVPCTVIPDTAVGHLMRQQRPDLVIVGADRIAANGDVANKIGTYTLAVLAKTHGVPFYVAAPTTTIDRSCPSGAAIPIEERSGDEVVWAAGRLDNGNAGRVRVIAEGPAVRNWAFDVTPAALITAIVTEQGQVPATSNAIHHLLCETAGTTATPAA